jgi:hypothetical protein
MCEEDIDTIDESRKRAASRKEFRGCNKSFSVFSIADISIEAILFSIVCIFLDDTLTETFN